MRWLPISLQARAIWGKSTRPNYLNGVLFAAEQAKREGIDQISVVEFGVATGAGLLALERIAAAVEETSGVRISVYGFDAGPSGLPELIGDYRDCPDIWRAGDFPMDVGGLEAKLSPRTRLVIGDIRFTVPKFFAEYDPPPLGFVAVDVDLYSSTTAALKILTLPDKRMLNHMPMYFDDIYMHYDHRFAGELLAIEEFNEREPSVKIDEWRALRYGRPFPNEGWLDRMFMAHDLAAISRCSVLRSPFTFREDGTFCGSDSSTLSRQ